MSLQYITAQEEQPEESSISFEHVGGQDPNEVRTFNSSLFDRFTDLDTLVRHVSGSGNQQRGNRGLAGLLEHQHHRRTGR